MELGWFLVLCVAVIINIVRGMVFVALITFIYVVKYMLW